MDETISQVDSNFNKVCGIIINVAKTSCRPPMKRVNTAIKYTKLPGFDFDTHVTWPRNSYTLQPRLRRMVAFDNEDMLGTSRSLGRESGTPLSLSNASFSRRKFVTINEDDETTDLHPKFARDTRQSVSSNSNRSVEADFKKKDRKPLHRNTSHAITKYSKDTETSAKTKASNKNKDLSASKINCKSKYSNIKYNVQDTKHKETTRKIKTLYTSSKISLNRTPHSSEKETRIAKDKLNDKAKTFMTKPTERRPNKSLVHQFKKNIKPILEDFSDKYDQELVIHVPLDVGFQNQNTMAALETELRIITPRSLEEVKKIDCCTDIEQNICTRHVKINPKPTVVEKIAEIYCGKTKVQTESEPRQVDQFTEMEVRESETIYKIDSEIQTDILDNSFDRLAIPNVTLSKDKSEMAKGDISDLCSNSLPNLRVPGVRITPHKDGNKNVKKVLCKSASYIIGRATLTYTTRQKINFHVVGNNDSTTDSSSSHLAYPMNVVSIFKKEIENRKLSDYTAVDNSDNKDKPNIENTNYLNKIQSFHCSRDFGSSKLVKPSDIISTLNVNNDLLQNDYICEHFQRELNFIDSFFESLQYLETCSLSDKCYTQNKVENWVCNSAFDLRNVEYDSFISRLENGANFNDPETMASKSLCLLNLLIRDEQRRAKNLLFVLKMREDALKDFTKSQILWLENKKKQDNTDISTLKKKQRGALLKLQHECGEMQRMRKALLVLSEKRKVALMKTKRNIELKLKNHVSVDQLFLSKKKLKKNTGTDRNVVAPLKCFDFSSSGCDDGLVSRSKADTAFISPDIATIVTSVKSVEKCIQTGDSISRSILLDNLNGTLGENLVVVDGGYLNILFHNLSLPQIFSSGKQYEVNEEALKNVVNSANWQTKNFLESDVVERFMDQIKNGDVDRSTTPSTARSLVEEFDQYYKVLAEEDKSPVDSSDQEYRSSIVSEYSQTLISDSLAAQCGKRDSVSAMTSDCGFKILNKSLSDDGSCLCEKPVDVQSLQGKHLLSSITQATSLLVPAEATTVEELTTVDVPVPTKSSRITNTSADTVVNTYATPPGNNVASIHPPSLASQTCEAEELLRQQLAIEREIKALEQQQSQLLVVREIPDKPPPPYTPPTATRAPKLPRMFIADESVEERIRKTISNPACAADSTESFHLFVDDFCSEMLVKQSSQHSEEPWDSCNLLPQKSEDSINSLVKKTSRELKEVLTCLTYPSTSGVGSRRTDHIDEILFTEWRRCEPDWISLHTDEAIVKNQIFENIFEKVLAETMDAYQRTVLSGKLQKKE